MASEETGSAPLAVSEATVLAVIKAVGSTTLEDPVDIVEYVRTGDGEDAARLAAKAFGLESSPAAIEVEGTLPGVWVPVRRLSGCARCGDTHEKLTFQPFSRPVEQAGATIATHFCACPTTSEPILMIALPNPEREENQ